MKKRAFGRTVGGVVITGTLVALSLGACDGDDETTPPVATGGAGGSAGSGGVGGVVDPSRGDPADFPTSCFASCAEACDELETCGGATSSLYPLSHDDCMDRCALAENGPIWDDVSGHFKCCASQGSCELVAHCGGWLDHPAADASCDQICTCFFSEAVAALSAGRTAPEGYRFATDSLVVALGESARRAPLPRVRRTVLTPRGRFAEAHFAADAGSGAVAAVASLGRPLPTFRDRAGRLVAATGTIVVAAATAFERAAAAAVAARHAVVSARDPGLARPLRIVELADPWAALDAVAELRAAGVAAELDMLREIEKRYVPDDPLFGDQWHLRNTGQAPSFMGVDARVSEAWDLELGSPQVIIAINDDGVDLGHPDFAGKLEPELNFPADWQTIMAVGNFAMHGTSVAGVAGAKADDTLGGAGACPGCRILPHRLGESTLNSFNVTDVEVADGFKAQVDAGAWLINNSWGLSLGDPRYADATLPIGSLPAVIAASFDYAETSGRGGLGTVILYAAGNHNQELDFYGTYPTVFSVGAVGDNGLKSYYSAFGPAVDIAAPSNGAFAGITTSEAGGGYTNDFGGTSSASPLVSGILGLVFSANPGLTAAEARALLMDGATEIDRVFGAYQNGHSEFYGAGLVNAYVSVALANGTCADAASCVAPSDDCGGSCGTLASCAPCRTHADCAPGHVCQALPSIGALVCVADDTGGCGAGTQAVNGYCLPSPQTCGVCGGAETCNGRDDDCNGSVDEGGVCPGAPRCFADGPGCGAGMGCAGSSCVTLCADDAGCQATEQCKPLKDQYGAVEPSVKGCVADQASQCQIGCSVVVSSIDDATLADFIACTQDGQAACNALIGCISYLPVTL